MIFTITYKYNNALHKPMKVKNCMSAMHAKMRLGEYLERKHGKGELVVMSCVEETGVFRDIFKEIFKG